MADPSPTPDPTPPADPPPTPTPPDDDDTNDDNLTEREQRWKREATARRRETRAAQQTADDLRAQLEKLRGEQESETDKRVREAVDAAVAETTSKFERQLFEARVLAAAAGKFVDPNDAVAHLPIDELLAHPDDLDDELDKLLKDKPYLGASTPNGSTSTAPLVTQGARGAPAAADKDDPDAWLRARARRR